MPVTIVVGAQYGSEGKGNICSKLANEYDMHVRTGGPNAGHSHKFKGKTYKQQVLPVGWVNPEASLIIGRGACIDLKQLKEEIRWAGEAGCPVDVRLFIDANASILDERHRYEEGGVDGEIHRRFGSTGKGVGACRRGRIHRDVGTHTLARNVDWLKPYLTRDTPRMLSSASRTQRVLVEGTQGTGLSLLHGPWPWVTSADTTASGFAAEAGIPPTEVDDVILVVRTLPIRVAGNSGPLANEIDWDVVSGRTGKATIETTTVTNKVRRVGEWDESLFEQAIQLNGPTQIAVNFIDYLEPMDTGVQEFSSLTMRSQQFIHYLEYMANAPVTMVGTGGDNWNVIRRSL